MSEWRNLPAGKIARQRREIVRLEPDIEYRTMGVRWYGKGAYDRGIVTTETVKAKHLYRARKGDFTFNRIDTDKGAFDVVSTDLDGALATNEFPLFEVDEEVINAYFLLLYFQSPEVLRQIGAVRAGSEGRARWKEAEFEAWVVPVPPLPIQTRIIEVIGTIDDQIAALDSEANAAEAVAAAVAEQMLDHHAHVPVGKHLDRIEGGRSPRAIDTPPGEDAEGVLKVSAVVAFQFIADESKTLVSGTEMPDSSKVQGGDVLITRASGAINRVGAVCRVPSDVRGGLYLSDKTLRMVPTDDLDPDFLVVAMALPAVRRQIAVAASGTASMKNLSQSKISELEIPLPELSEQHRVASTVLSIRSFEDKSRAEAGRLRAVRAGLLSGLLDRTIDIESAELGV